MPNFEMDYAFCSNLFPFYLFGNVGWGFFQIARKLEAVNSVKEPLKSDLLNGKWELLYTTSQSVLQTQVCGFVCI